MPIASSTSGRRRALTFVVLGGLSAFGPLATDLYLPALPEVGRDLGAGQGVVQLTISSSLVGLALGQLVAGPLSDNLGRKRPLLVGLVGFVVLSLVCVVAPNVWLLILARLLQGGCGAAGLVIARAIVRDLWGPVDSGRVFAELTIVSGLAPIVAPLLGAQLLRVTSWRGLFVVLAGIGVLLALGALTLRESLPAERRRSDGLRQTLSVGADLARSRAFVGYALAAGFGTACLLTYIAASPFVLQTGYGVSTTVFSVVFATNSVGIVVAGQVGGRLVRRVGSGRLLTVGQVAQAAGTVTLLVVALSGTRALVPLLVPLFVVVACVGLVSPHSTALALAPHPDVAGSASALVGASQFLFAGLISPLGGVGGTGSAVPMALTMAVVAVVSLVLCRWLTRDPG
ncbi:multidrug effflux MFS transporter [Jatrophihabitans sp. YIM 134969]